MKILGINVDSVTMDQALKKVEGWLKNKKTKHYIVTPNLEFIKDAQKDPEFKKILNKADLAIPDSTRLSWLRRLTIEKNYLKRLLIFPQGIFPQVTHFDVVTGIDLMERLCKVASEKAFTVGLLGGASGVAELCAERLQKKYPKLDVVFINSGGSTPTKSGSTHTPYHIPHTNILFVAFGHGKQEKWIAQNLDKIPVNVAMGVGGSFDVISGNVPRAPVLMRDMGMEWLFRLIVQPWRIKRQLKLVLFLVKILFINYLR